MENLISVIVTTYNHETTIGRTLDSILAQQCHLPVEIVIGEDCSTDGTLDICRQYAQKHPEQIHLIANEKNKGIVDNYFDCLLAARGAYIADCAGDDFWTDLQKLEKEAQILETHEDVTLVHTDWLYYDETSGRTRPHTRRHFTDAFTDGTSMLEAILTQTTLPVVHLCTALYRKSAFLKAYEEDTFVFRNKEFGCEDLSLTFMLARMGRIAYLPDVTLHYSIGHNSVSFNEDDARQFRFVKRISSLTRYLSRKYHVTSPTIERHLQERMYALTMHAFRAHDSQLRREAIDLGKEWGIEPLGKTRFVTALTGSKATWTMALALRRLLVSVKHRAQ